MVEVPSHFVRLSQDAEPVQMCKTGGREKSKSSDQGPLVGTF